MKRTLTAWSRPPHRRHLGCFGIERRCAMAPAGWGWGPGIAAGIIGGAIITGAIIASRPRGYVVYEGYGRPVNHAGCYWASQPVYDRFGRVVGYTGEPVQVCPGYIRLTRRHPCDVLTLRCRLRNPAAAPAPAGFSFLRWLFSGRRALHVLEHRRVGQQSTFRPLAF